MKNIEQSTSLVNVMSCIQFLRENHSDGWCAYNIREKILYELKIYTEKDIIEEKEYIKKGSYALRFESFMSRNEEPPYHSVGDYSLRPITNCNLKEPRPLTMNYEKTTITLKHLEVAEWEIIKTKPMSFVNALDSLNKGISVAAVDFAKGREELKNIDDMVKYLKKSMLSGLYYCYYEI